MARKKQYSVWVAVEEDNGMSKTVTRKKVDEFHAKSVADAVSTCLASYYDREFKPKSKSK